MLSIVWTWNRSKDWYETCPPVTERAMTNFRNSDCARQVKNGQIRGQRFRCVRQALAEILTDTVPHLKLDETIHPVPPCNRIIIKLLIKLIASP